MGVSLHGLYPRGTPVGEEQEGRLAAEGWLEKWEAGCGRRPASLGTAGSARGQSPLLRPPGTPEPRLDPGG